MTHFDPDVGGRGLKYCSECGSQLGEGARYCDRCGAGVGDNETRIAESAKTGDIYRSTRLYVSQQRLIAAVIFAGLGILLLVMAVSIPPMPSEPFGPADDYTFNTIAGATGFVFIAIGLAIYFLGGFLQGSD